MVFDFYGDAKTGIHGGIKYKPRDVDLMPCPFCGCPKPEIVNTHTPAYWVECPECYGHAKGEYTFGDRLTTRAQAEREHVRAFESAVDRWNTRVLRTADVNFHLFCKPIFLKKGRRA